MVIVDFKRENLSDGDEKLAKKTPILSVSPLPGINKSM